MQRENLIVSLLVVCLIHDIKADAHFRQRNVRNTMLTASDGNAYANERATLPTKWQSMPPSNWIILQSDRRDEISSSGVGGDGVGDAGDDESIGNSINIYPYAQRQRRRSYSRSGVAVKQTPTVPSASQQHQHQHQQQRQQQNSYYAYERSYRNYSQPKRQDMRMAEHSPYVLAIRNVPVLQQQQQQQQRQHQQQQTDVFGTRTFPLSSSSGKITAIARTQASHHHRPLPPSPQPDAMSSPSASTLVAATAQQTTNTASNTTTTTTTTNNNVKGTTNGKVDDIKGVSTPADIKRKIDNDSVDIEAIENEQQQQQSNNADDDDKRLNEILLPLQSTLEKVKSFCDAIQELIGNDVDHKSDNDIKNNDAISGAHGDDDDDDDADDDEDKVGETSGGDDDNSATTITTTTAAAATTTRTAITTPQSEAEARSNDKSAIGTGRGKKLKKKLKKLLLPLLIAYKLKFLTLIPVLIGGLTLLVGTTGLAGFFFALFTAVMSLKAGGSKSIVVKKI